MSGRRGVYPGTFNPPTHAHLHLADAARRQHDLAVVDLAVSRRPLDKEHVEVPRLVHRLAVLRDVVATRPWLGLVVTEETLIVEIAAGYDVVVMGADKWAQVNDARYYADEAARDDALARLPAAAVAPRPPSPVPDARRLVVDETVAAMSSTGARAGRREWMLPEAAAFDDATGAWSDPARYGRWLATQAGITS